MTAQLRLKYAFVSCATLFFLVVTESLSNRCLAQGCSDPMPPDFACTAVRPLGEMERCACFVCFATDGSRGKTVCTADQSIKAKLLNRPRR